MRDLWDDFGGAIIATVFAIVSVLCLVCSIGGLSWHGDHVSCLRLSEQTGYQTRMAGNMFSGECYINVDGKWMPADRYRGIDDSDGL